jgi:hypothetical protein
VVSVNVLIFKDAISNHTPASPSCAFEYAENDNDEKIQFSLCRKYNYLEKKLWSIILFFWVFTTS